jgi:DUF1707 SHOCT-like domain
MMPGDPRLRVSDADRERACELLREHHAVGRLTREEFEGRLEGAFAARTRGELDELLADLPAIDLYRLPSAGIRPGPPGRMRRDLARPGSADGGVARQVAGWSAWVAVGSVSLLVWLGLAVSYGGAAWFPWFLLVVIPWWVALTRHRR